MSAVAQKKLKELLSLNVAPNCLLLVCPDIVRFERIASHFKNKFFDSKSEPPQVFYAENVKKNFSTFIDEVYAQSLFSSNKLYLVKDSDKFSGDIAKKIIDIINQPSGNSVIFYSSKIKSNSILYKAFKKIGLVLEVSELKGLELKKWTLKELTQNGFKKVSNKVVDSLIDICENSPDRIANHCKMLSLYCNSETLSESDLLSLFPEALSINDFDILESLRKKDYSQTENLIEKMSLSGKSFFLTLAMISRNYNQSASIKYLQLKGERNINIRTKLGIKPWVFDKIVSFSNTNSLDRIDEAFNSIILADSKLKNKNIGEDLIASELSYKLCQVDTK